MAAINGQADTCFLCLKPNPSLTCDKCHIRACGRSHLEVHSGLDCAPFAIKDAGFRNGGRHFVAGRNIKASEVILVDEPAVVGPSTRTSPVCLECLNGDEEGTCAECQMPLCDGCRDVKKRSKLLFHTQLECDSLKV